VSAATPPLVEVDRLVKHFPVRRGFFTSRAAGVVRAVDGVSFAVARGEVVGLVGESGSGKSTIGRAVLRLIEPTAGRVTFDGADVTTLPRGALRALRRRMQIVFQDPFGSLDPRRRVEDQLRHVLELGHVDEILAPRQARLPRPSSVLRT